MSREEEEKAFVRTVVCAMDMFKNATCSASSSNDEGSGGDPDDLFEVNETTELGSERMKRLFCVGKDVTNCNHGSFGNPPLSIAATRLLRQLKIDMDTERFYRVERPKATAHVRDVVREYLSVNPSLQDEVQIVTNAADAFNIAANSYIFNPGYIQWYRGELRGRKEGDGSPPEPVSPLRVGLVGSAYPMVQKALDHYSQKYAAVSMGAEVVKLCLTTAALESDDKIIDTVMSWLAAQQVAAKGSPVDVFVIDHYSWNPGFVVPLLRLSKAIRAKWPHMLIVVDGAHAVGMLDIEFHPRGNKQEKGEQEEDGAQVGTTCRLYDADTGNEPPFDIYFSNFHKWLMCPKAAAFLFVKRRLRQFLHPNVISNFYGQGTDKEFTWEGTRDFSTMLVLPDLIAWRQKLGERRIQAFCRDIAYQGAQRAAGIWGTSLLITDRRRLGALVCVALPPRVASHWDKCQKITIYMAEHRKTFVPELFFDGLCYARFSGQIYNNVRDYEVCAQTFLEVMNKMLEELGDGKWEVDAGMGLRVEKK